jgi:hypothetical protein
VAVTFDFSASWTRAQDATWYLLCVDNIEAAATCWQFPTTKPGSLSQPGAGVATLSFSATNLYEGCALLPTGTCVVWNLDFWVEAWSPIHGSAYSNRVTEQHTTS